MPIISSTFSKIFARIQNFYLQEKKLLISNLKSNCIFAPRNEKIKYKYSVVELR